MIINFLIIIQENMANIMDYLKWRGDLSFAQSPFNEVDNLILSELVYVEFAGIVPSPGKGSITLEEANNAFFATHTDEEINARVSSTKVAAFMMREMAQTNRFGKIKLSAYINDIRVEEQSQFCAMVVELGDGLCNVVYSGTDDTIVGWKEDFNMSFLSETPGQLKAVAYLENVAEHTDARLRLMGHSKGGNLAVYAAIHANCGISRRIDIIYSDDGPGFTESMIDLESYRNILPRIHTIIPESSIVGMLFQHEEEYEVVASTGNGAGQHDVMSWEVMGPALVHLNKVNEKAILLDKTLKSWIYGMDEAQRENFVDTLFGILDEADIRTVDDLANMNPAKFVELIRLGTTLEKGNQQMLRDSMRRFWEQSTNTLKNVIFKK